MSKVIECIELIRRGDFSFSVINFFGAQYDSFEIHVLVECLLAYPTAIKSIQLVRQRLWDDTDILLAKYISKTTTLTSLHIPFKYHAYKYIAVALYTNSSLQQLSFYNNFCDNPSVIYEVFVNALRLNPCRPKDSVWQLFKIGWNDIDFKRLKDVAEKSTSPSMLEFLLCIDLIAEKIKAKTH